MGVMLCCHVRPSLVCVPCLAVNMICMKSCSFEVVCVL